MPMPETCCDSPSGTVRVAWRRPNTAPTRSTTSSAGQRSEAEPDRHPPGHGAGGEDALDAEVEDAGALADQRAQHAEDQRRADPDRRRPEIRREQDVEEIHGAQAPEAGRSARAPGEAQAEAGEEAADQDAEQRQRDDEVGDVARDAEAAAHRIGTDEDRGDEQRRGDHAERRQAGEHRDDDAGIAEAGREVVGEVALEARHLAHPGKAGERPGEQRDADHRGGDRNAGEAGGGRVLADGADLHAPHRAPHHHPDRERRRRGR